MALDNKTAPTEEEIFIKSCEAEGIILDDDNLKRFHRRTFTTIVKKGIISACGEDATIDFKTAWSIEVVKQELIDMYDAFKAYAKEERTKKLDEQKAVAEPVFNAVTPVVEENVSAGGEAEVSPDAENVLPAEEAGAESKPVVSENEPDNNSTDNSGLSGQPPKKEKKSKEKQENNESDSLFNLISGSSTKSVNNSKYSSKKEVSLAITQVKKSRDLVQRPGNTISFEGYSYHIMKAITECYNETGEKFDGKEFKGIKEVVAAAVRLLAAKMEESGDKKYTDAIKKELQSYNKKRAEFDAQIAELEKIRDNM